MVKYSEERLNRVFSALADPTRRAILARLGEQNGLSVSEIARPLRLKLPGLMKHLEVLREAGLLTRHKSGRTVHIELAAGPMEEATVWLQRYERFWSAGLDRLARMLEEDPA